jgi:hypothetical protein
LIIVLSTACTIEQHQLVARDAGVVHQHVDSSVEFERARHGRLDGVRVRHIDRHGFGPPPGGDNFVSHGLGVLAPGRGHDGQAPTGQGQ